jgi:hypothetical protein
MSRPGNQARIYSLREFLETTWCRGCQITFRAQRPYHELCPACYHGKMAGELLEAARWHLDRKREAQVF